MDKAGKAVALEAYKTVFANAGVIVVTQYSGLTVRELTDLRVKLKGEGASLKVIKNRLAKIALDGKGGDKAGAMFVGPVAIAYSPDPGPVFVVDESETAVVARVPVRAFINPENRLMVYRKANTRRLAGQLSAP